MRVTTFTSGTLVAIVLVAVGCGGGDENGSAAVQTTAGDANVQAVKTAAAQPAPAAEPSDAQNGLASRDSQIDKVPIRLEITELRRSGATSAITIRLVVTDDTGDGSAQIADTLDDGISDAENGNEYDTTDGISLIDTVNRKRYLVARDSSGRCVCDNSLSGTFVRSVGPTVLSATFAAPPEDVKAVDVVIPRFGTFKNVPIS